MFAITEKPAGVFNVIVDPQDKHWDCTLPSVFVLPLIVVRGDGRAEMLTSVRRFPMGKSESEAEQMENRALSWLNLLFEQWWTRNLTDQELKRGFDTRRQVSNDLLRKYGFDPSSEVTRAQLDLINEGFQADADQYWEHGLKPIR